MIKDSTRKIIWTLIYWLLSTLLVISLFLTIFGSVAFLSVHGIIITKVLGLSFSIIGSIIFMISLTRPYSLMDPFLRKNRPKDNKNYDPADKPINFLILGLFMMIGGVFYGVTGNVVAMIICMWIPSIIVFILRLYVSKSSK